MLPLALAWGRTEESEQAVASFLQARGHTGTLELPLAQRRALFGLRQRCAAPLLSGASCSGHARPRHAELHRSKRAEQLALARRVPAALRLTFRPLVPRAAQPRCELLPQRVLDKPAHLRGCPPRSGPTKPHRQTASCRLLASSCCCVPWLGLRRRSNAGNGAWNKPETTPPTYLHHLTASHDCCSALF